MTSLPHPITGRGFPSPVPPGQGWPDDPADAATPVAASPADVVGLAEDVAMPELGARVSVCRACPRLVAWREEVAASKRASFRDQPYWGRPAPGFGPPDAPVLIVGLAPAANGANRTGRVFTGDASGDWLYASLHRVGLASQAQSRHAGDGLRLAGCRVAAAVRCAPPANKPTPEEQRTCQPWLEREVTLLLPRLRVVVALGGFAWTACLRVLTEVGYEIPRPRPSFGHRAEAVLAGPRRPLTLLGSYHPSQQNTFTGRLTESMLDDVLARAATVGSGRV